MATEDEELDEDRCWYELLERNQLFGRFRDSEGMAGGNRNLMCEIRGDLFVWCGSHKTMLTTNLKRIVAKPTEKQVFQVCLLPILNLCIC